ncbi:uncharacterized protein K441DRAFT_551606, partial [Cenococcum geophilum 1.58]|uniref:uncharacterized protein n=1 Tax=Cenococcum geophilum 1.58 TaxID=794803 RepID=UPI00358E7A2F
LVKHFILSGVKKRKRSEIPLERMASNNKVRYIKQERAVKRIADYNPNYKDTLIKSLLE